MRFASACLVSLVVAYTCFGQSDEPAPTSVKTACPLSAASQSACSQSACSKAAACPTETACPSAAYPTTACAQPSACASAVASTKTAACPSNTACANNSACNDHAACTSIADCAANRVAARVALSKEQAACQTRATTDAISRHPELIGVSTRVATPACTTSAGACATATCTTAAGETTACKSASCDKSACCKNACTKSECCPTETTAVATDDTCTPGMRKCFELNSHEATMVTSAERFDHLQQAAEHLAAADCKNEAACVTAWATEVKQNLAAHMREMSEVLKEAAGELEEELKSEATAKTTSAPATGEPVAAACSTKSCDNTAACYRTACESACPGVAVAAAKSCEVPKTCDTPQQNGDLQRVCGTNVKIIEVCLSDLHNLGHELPGCPLPGAGSPHQVCIELVCPEKLQAKLDELERHGLVKVVNVPCFVAASGQAVEIKHPDSGSHICVQTQILDGGRVKVVITPCESSPPPANPHLARYKRTYEVDAHFEMNCGQAAVVGGQVHERARVEKRAGLTSVTVYQSKSQHQTLFIVTPAASEASAVKQVSHTEPAANESVSACPTACGKAVLKTTKKSCDESACQTAAACPTSATCPTAACPTATNCDTAHTPACHAATGVATSTCPLTSDVQLLTACAAAQACAAKTARAIACQQKSCDTQTAAACSKTLSCTATAACEAAACPTATACEKKLDCDASAYLPTFKRDKSQCEKTQCDQTGACPTAVASGNSLVRPATPFLAEAVATDAPSACASGAAECCERNKSCPTGACCRQGEATAMASASDEPCATEACADAPCAGATGAVLAGAGVNSDAGCIGVIACDSGVQATAMPVATGSYLKLHLSHLTKAAVHLSEAGLAEEAASVSELANQLRQELIATKQAQIAGLQAEIAALQADCDAVCRAPSTDSAMAVPVCPPAVCAEPECDSPMAVPVVPAPRKKAARLEKGNENKQILLKVKVVEVSMGRLKQLGFGFATMQPGVPLPAEGLDSFLEALKREHVAKVLAEPTLLLGDRRPGSFHSGGNVSLPKPGGRAGEFTMHEIGTRLNALACLLDNNRVRIDVRPRIAELQTQGEHGPSICVRELDAGFETELGKTVVLAGLLQEQVRMEKDPDTLAERPVHDQRQTFFLVTPCRVIFESDVKPVNHEAEFGVPAAGFRNFTRGHRIDSAF